MAAVRYLFVLCVILGVAYNANAANAKDEQLAKFIRQATNYAAAISEKVNWDNVAGAVAKLVLNFENRPEFPELVSAAKRLGIDAFQQALKHAPEFLQIFG